MILLIASGVRFGFRPTLPHVLGVAAGVGVTAGLTGLGLGALLTRLPALAFALKLIAAAWILWMAWKLFRSTRMAAVETKDKPFTFIEAVLFQWVNPKVWAVALAATAGFTVDLPPAEAAQRLALAFASINLGVCLFYATLGHGLAPLMKSPVVWRIFMTVMAALLAASALFVLVG